MQHIAGIRMKRPAPKGSRPVQVKVTLVLGCLAICVLPLAEAPAFANPATYPRRVINQQQQPLMVQNEPVMENQVRIAFSACFSSWRSRPCLLVRVVCRRAHFCCVSCFVASRW